MDQVTGASTTATSALLALSKSLDSAKFENFSKVLEVGLYVVLGRVAGGLLSSAYAMRVNAKAAAELTLANSIAAAGEVRRLEAVKAGVVADLARARSSVASAEASVMASRQVQTADLARLQTVRQSLVAELERAATPACANFRYWPATVCRPDGRTATGRNGDHSAAYRRRGAADGNHHCRFCGRHCIPGATYRCN